MLLWVLIKSDFATLGSRVAIKPVLSIAEGREGL